MVFLSQQKTIGCTWRGWDAVLILDSELFYCIFFSYGIPATDTIIYCDLHSVHKNYGGVFVLPFGRDY